MDASISAATLEQSIRSSAPPLVIDALYAWCKEGKDEIHTWKPAAYK